MFAYTKYNNDQELSVQVLKIECKMVMHFSDIEML